MNPSSASIPAPPRPVVSDINTPAPAPTAPMPQDTPNIVSNIPIHNPGVQAVAAPNEDDELDKIMHDVGQEMKQQDNKKAGKRVFLNFIHRPKPLPTSPAKAQTVQQAPPAPAPAPQPAPPVAVAVAPVPQPTPAPKPAAAPITQNQPKPAPATGPVLKSKLPRTAPVFVIFVALLVTSFLAVAAIAAYRQ
jgi:hypothetical protein